MDDKAITAMVGWPTAVEMVKYRAVAAAAIAAEREACANACDYEQSQPHDDGVLEGFAQAAEIIRKRSNAPLQPREASAASDG